MATFHRHCFLSQASPLGLHRAANQPPLSAATLAASVMCHGVGRTIANYLFIFLSLVSSVGRALDCLTPGAGPKVASSNRGPESEVNPTDTPQCLHIAHISLPSRPTPPVLFTSAHVTIRRIGRAPKPTAAVSAHDIRSMVHRPPSCRRLREAKRCTCMPTRVAIMPEVGFEPTRRLLQWILSPPP